MRPATPIALAIVLVGAALSAWTLRHLMASGSCSSSTRYVARHPCRAGTGAFLVLAAAVLLGFSA
jgi:hypothetical protein